MSSSVCECEWCKGHAESLVEPFVRPEKEVEKKTLDNRMSLDYFWDSMLKLDPAVVRGGWYWI